MYIYTYNLTYIHIIYIYNFLKLQLVLDVEKQSNIYN